MNSSGVQPLANDDFGDFGSTSQSSTGRNSIDFGNFGSAPAPVSTERKASTSVMASQHNATLFFPGEVFA